MLDNIIQSPDDQIKRCVYRFNWNSLDSQFVTHPRHLPPSLFHLTHQSPGPSVTTHNTQYIASVICAIRSSYCRWLKCWGGRVTCSWSPPSFLLLRHLLEFLIMIRNYARVCLSTSEYKTFTRCSWQCL